MRILLDTNIFIPLEDSSSVLEDSLGQLVRLVSENNHQLLVHPSSIEDINRDRDEDRHQINLSRIKKYSLLIDPPVLSDSDREQLGLSERNDNDRVDNQIVYALYKNAVNLLVTEDRGIHKKAESLGIENRVYYIQQASSSLEKLHLKVTINLPNISEEPLHNIDLNTPFFDSLRENYSGFNDWFQKASREGRKAWIHINDSGILGAIAIYKEEEDPIVTSDSKAIRGKVLKLCTFKVGESVRGKKIGELLLKASFRYATENQFAHIYLTMRSDKQIYLADLCEDFGFYRLGEYENDWVYVKDHPVEPPEEEIPPFSYHKKYYPHFRSDQDVAKYIVPILPQYHAILFPDIEIQTPLFTFSTAGNPIKQAYLCHAKITRINPGDLLLFYRSSDWQAVTSIGVVEMVFDTQDENEILGLVAKRTVYSYDEIKIMVEKQTKVLLFRLAKHFRNPMEYRWLKENAIVSGPIQSIRGINHEGFEKILASQ